MAITDSWLKANHNKPTPTPYEKTDGGGLSVRVSSTGKLVFQLRYRHNKKACRVDLGTYPMLGLKEARREALRLKGLLEKGHDPRLVKRVEKAKIAKTLTNRQLYMEWHRSYAVDNIKSHMQYKRSFELHVFPRLGGLPADETNAHTWLELIKEICETRPSIAERVLVTVKQIHRWGHRRQLIKNKPLADVSFSKEFNVLKEPEGRALTKDEIGIFWHSVQRSGICRMHQIFLLLCLALGCRGVELRHLNPLEDLDFDTPEGLPPGTIVWRLPYNKHKVGKKLKIDIIRPIIPELVPYIKEAMQLSNSPQLLFSQVKTPTPITHNQSIRFPALVMRRATRYYGGMGHFAMNYLRKTARTNFSTITQWHIAELMLGHSIGELQTSYDFYEYMPEMVEAYQKWWNRIQECVARVPPPELAAGWKPTDKFTPVQLANGNARKGTSKRRKPEPLPPPPVEPEELEEEVMA